MWWVFDNKFTLQTVIDTFTEITINHHFFAMDDATFSLPYSDDNYLNLSIGNILYKKGSQKGFIIHSLEVHEQDNTIWASCFGMEWMLDWRIVTAPTIYNNNYHEDIMVDLVNNHLVNPTDTSRKISSLIGGTKNHRGIVSTETYFGDSIYSICNDLSKRSKIGFKVYFDPVNKQYQFNTFVGTDKTVNILTGGHVTVPPLSDGTQPAQPTPDPNNVAIRWSHNWGDTSDEVLATSIKDWKNTVYVSSGDNTPIVIETDNILPSDPSFDGGFGRYEVYLNASDVKQNMSDGTNTTVLTSDQEKSLLKTKGRIELANHPNTIEYTFTLSPDIKEVYGTDYIEGDYVSVINEKYNLTKNSQITTVQEHWLGEMVQYQITFDEK